MSSEVDRIEESGSCTETNGGSTCVRNPRMDIVETAEEFRIDVELPGVPPEAVDVDLENGLLRIRGKVAPPETIGGRTRVRERFAGEFSQSLRLSDSIDTGKITARARDGLLTLHLPKVGARKPRSIPVATPS